MDADDKNFVGQPCCDQLLNNIWYDKMEPFQSTISKQLLLFLSLCTFGLVAPLMISFREEQDDLDYSSNDHRRTPEMMVNETDEEREEFFPRRTRRYISCKGFFPP